MSTRKMVLANPKAVKDGVVASAVEVDYIYFHKDTITVYTKQGLSKTLPYNSKITKALADIEDDLLAVVDVPEP